MNGAAGCDATGRHRGAQGARSATSALPRALEAELKRFKRAVGMARRPVAARSASGSIAVAAVTLDAPASPEHTIDAAAQSAAGFGSPCREARMRPSADAGAFFVPASLGQLRLPVQRRAVRGSRKARRSSRRSSNRAPSVTPFGSGLTVTPLREDRHHE